MRILKNVDRDAQITERFLKGETYKGLGAAYNLFGTRIQQIVERNLRRARLDHKTLAPTPGQWRREQ